MQEIRELLAQLKLSVQVDIAIADKLEEIEKRLYALEENMKLARGANKSNALRLGELTLALADLRQEVNRKNG